MPKIGMQSIRKQQLIDATLIVVNEVGMQEATIAQIARKAGVSNGIISHYFKDKNGLLEATMRYLLHQLGMAVTCRLRLLDNATPTQRLKAIVEGNFDPSQISGAAMKTWLAFWASSMHQPNLYRLQQVNERRLYSNICVEFKRAMPKAEARLAAQGLAALIDGIWLRSALSNKPFDIEGTFRITIDYIEQKLGTSDIA
ncbi:transcriptional regulator BetI [Xenorhabdus japonica]|uniref:HTH-type transcriptional regulator BetI n=1 Tax=Xenorhabdus japonica TaxID=53341 RepID=A0A1I5A6H7_9GAMM|nr:transcriptional regulator BetI [Xenorhabdus japonica]SFN58045.1 transcriptional regulator, TetR family [Xenorhabdus japonica]